MFFACKVFKHEWRYWAYLLLSIPNIYGGALNIHYLHELSNLLWSFRQRIALLKVTPTCRGYQRINIPIHLHISTSLHVRAHPAVSERPDYS